MSEPRKHHYLSQFYLLGFSPDGRRVYQIEKDTGRSYPCSIRDAAAIRDYHELDYSDADDPNALEKQLSGVEGHLAANLHEVINSGFTTVAHHARLIELVSLLRVRVPTYKAYIEKTLEESARSIGKLLERHGRLPKATKPGASIMDELAISISNWKCLQFMFMLAADPDVLGLLASMKATLLDAPEGSSFLTCDQPVALFHPTARSDDFYGVGLIDPATEITLALSSRVLLRLTWPSAESERRPASASEVGEFNRRTIIMATSLVFASATPDSTMTDISRYKMYSAGPEHAVTDMGESLFHVVRNRAVMSHDRYR